MDAKRFAANMRALVLEIKDSGTDSIKCENLIAYLDQVIQAPGSEPDLIQLEKYKADLQRWVSENNHRHEAQLEMFRSVITAGQGAIKSAFLLNGGAAVALLAFIAHLAQ